MKRPRFGGAFVLLLAWWQAIYASTFICQPGPFNASSRGEYETGRHAVAAVHSTSPLLSSEDAQDWLPDELPNFFEVAAAEAQERNMTARQYLRLLNHSATVFINSEEIADREEFMDSLNQAMTTEGRHTLVIGGKSLAKTKVIDAVARRLERSTGCKITVVDVNMREKPYVPLYDALQQRAAQASPSVAQLVSAMAATAAALGLGEPKAAPLVNAVSKGVGEAVQETVKFVSALPEVQKKLEWLSNFVISMNRAGNRTVFIIDEANLALPDGLGDPSPQHGISYMVHLTKEKHKATVILLSSEVAYPYRLAKAGLSLMDIDQVIMVGEVPRKDMMALLIRTWGMGYELANAFFSVFGGHIFLSRRGIELLMEKKEEFDPFSVLRLTELTDCINNPSARAHLENIAKKGFSPVESMSDVGAKLIAHAGLGGVITRDATTFQLSTDIWKSGMHKLALVPSFRLMRLAIIEELKFAPPLAPNAEQVIINITYKDISAQVKFKKGDSDTAAIKEAICQAIGVPTGSVLRARDKQGCDVAITGGLDKGEYEVMATSGSIMTLPDQVILELIYKGSSYCVKFSKYAHVEVVEKTICRRLRLPAGTPIELIDKDGASTEISGNTPSGTYSVEVVPSC